MASASGELKKLRAERFFAGWDGFVDAKRVKSAEASIRRLIDDLIALGRGRTEAAARRAVDACVRRFNRMDDGWICTIEREDIFEQIGRVIDACGFDYDEDWLDERDW
jgi:hypothetical protein